ncbi:MAG TPA: aminopeptidase [Burkholderiales bacterium]|jgi:predicted aminopeptidase
MNRQDAKRIGILIVAACFALLLSGCANVGYYFQSVSGQLDIWRRERPVEEVIADPAVSTALKERLARVLEIRAFASRELSLPDNASYRSYADLGRSHVVWIVFAAPEFSVQPHQSCFLFAGCVSYRGYFAREDAERYSAGLAGEGYDVYIGGVPAYSTLGWFADPVLNTFIDYPDAEIARLIFHELAHQVAYARDDTVFNESFAAAVEQEGVRRWLAVGGDTQQLRQFDQRRRIRGEFSGLVQNYRERLDALYRTRLAPDALRDRKRAILAELASEYRSRKAGWGGFTGYDSWFAGTPNNAQLASVAVYSQQVPAFEALLAREGGNLARFYAAVQELAALPKAERDSRMNALVHPVAGI